MDQFEQLFEEKCKLHPSYYSEFLLIHESSPGEKLCSHCIHEKDISKIKVLSIKDLLKSPKDTIFNSYPPLNDININLALQSLLSHNFQSKIIEEIEMFFTELREKISLFLDKKLTQTKLEAIHILNAEQKLLEEYDSIADIFTLKQLILNKNHDQLRHLIKQKIIDSKKNTQTILDILDNLKQISSNYLIDQAKIEAQFIVKAIENLHLFKSYSENTLNLVQVNFIPSKFEDSQKNLKISKLDNNLMQITHVGKQKSDIVHGYFDFILDPKINYVMRVQIQSKSGLKDPWFYFGIQPEEYQDYDLWSFKLGYCEVGDTYAVSKIVKGEKLQSGKVSNVKKTLEFRIQLNSKIFKVADYPAYSSVMKIKDENEIDIKQKYKLIIGMSQPKDEIIIEDFYKVYQFDTKMD